MLRLSVTAASALALASCATTYNLSVAPSSEQELSYHRGIPAISSALENSVVEVVPRSTTFEGRTVLFIAAFNDSGIPHNLGVENLTVLRDGENHRVFTFAELEAEARRAAAWEQFAVALNSAAQSYANAQAGYTNSYTSYSGYGSGTATNQYGSTSVSGTVSGSSSTTTYDPSVSRGLEAQNQARTQADLARIEGELAAVTRDLQQNILRTTTIRPGQSFGGRVVIDTPSLDDGSDEIVVQVEFAGDLHTFTLVADKQ